MTEWPEWTAEPGLSIVMPAGSPARGGALEWVMAAAAPAEGFVDAGVSVDGIAIACRVRTLPNATSISAWCDTRGVPPGLHEIAVNARWAGGAHAFATRLMVVTVGEPAEWWNVPPADVPAPVVVGISDPGLDESLARTALGGPPLVLLDDDAVLGPGAVERIAAAFADPAGVDVVIGDEASMIAEKRWMRWRKRAFQPEALPGVDLVGPLLAVGPRAADVLCDALPAVAGIYGLALELLDRDLQTVALRHVLALTPQVRMPADGAPARRAIERLAARRGRDVTIGEAPVAGLRDVRWPLAAEPEVVAVLPSRTPALAARCLAAVAERTSYSALRAVVVDSSDDEDEMRRVVDAAAIGATRVRYPAGEPFNYQVAVNLGTLEAGSAAVLFLNDDVRPLAADWLTRMVELLTLPGVGIVGAMLRHPDGSIQHAGVQVGEGSGHRYHDAPGDALGHRFELLVAGNTEAVTGACMLVRAELLEQLGGHDERYVHVYGDVDLCYRATGRGWRVAWCAGAELEHLESASYGTSLNEGDIARFLGQWVDDRGLSPSNRSAPDGRRGDVDAAFRGPARGGRGPRGARPGRRRGLGLVARRSAARIGHGRGGRGGGAAGGVAPGRQRGAGDRRDPLYAAVASVAGVPAGPAEVIATATGSDGIAVERRRTVEVVRAEARSGRPRPWAGLTERLDPRIAPGGLSHAEHVARYRWAAQLAEGRDVLDAACGVGYGAHLLQEGGARSVTGVDAFAGAIIEAREQGNAGLRFEVGDLLALPFEPDRFDLVVCFEAIEHIGEQERVLDEIRRVLRPGGLLVISTPVRGALTVHNPHHVAELAPDEFEALLRSRFDDVELRWQHSAVASLLDLGPKDGRPAPLSPSLPWTSGPIEPIYVVALAGDAGLPQPQPAGALGAGHDIAGLLSYVYEVLDEITEVRTELSAMSARAVRAENAYEALEQRHADVLAALEEMRSSRAWELTAPLRAGSEAWRGAAKRWQR